MKSDRFDWLWQTLGGLCFALAILSRIYAAFLLTTLGLAFVSFELDRWRPGPWDQFQAFFISVVSYVLAFIFAFVFRKSRLGPHDTP